LKALGVAHGRRCGVGVEVESIAGLKATGRDRVSKPLTRSHVTDPPSWPGRTVCT
jgi:hypothetical protein